MGVPRLSIWTRTTFPKAIRQFRKGEYRAKVDNVYVDCNAILHGSMQSSYGYGSKKRMVDPYAGKTYVERRLIGFQLFWESIRNILSQIVIPVKRIYLSIDGPAPKAKQVQQRERRFAAARDRLAGVTTAVEPEESVVFDSNQISPGTIFMLELTKFLQTEIRKELNSKKPFGIDNPVLEIIFSSPRVAGEGEHKLLDYLRVNPNKDKESHCMVGPDGDLIILCLAAQVPRIFLLREDQMEIDAWEYYDMGYIRQYLADAMGQDRGLYAKKITINDVVEAFILLGFFVGNDFLTKVQMFLYLENGLELMLATYAETSKGGLENQMTLKHGILSLNGFSTFVDALAKHEKRYLEDQLLAPLTNEMFVNKTMLKHAVHKVQGKDSWYILDFPAYRIDYYKKAGITDNLNEQVSQMCRDYVHNMAWIFKYYVSGVPSWTTFYPWHYPPLITDLAAYLKTLNERKFSEIVDVFPKDKPMLPFVQLLCVLPPPSAGLLPPPFRHLFTSPNSPLVQAGYFPKTFKVDYEGKTKEHMGIVLLPFVDLDVVVAAYEPIAAKLQQVYVRNIPGKDYVFSYDPTYIAGYTSDYGNISDLHVRKIEYKK